ncbi:hypothetical protein RBSWK_05323 [Rhodopirellula baltica SWK14]|uniref:Uncharacterized protein n=1 Tax=Rhodopirellula baltica SWK14 TaxID=993516 RepID=L7CAU4_RHOBT|nr:hypothetical protein RBSWK_05323 [Rhodopirellula baltica SWK14]
MEGITNFPVALSFLCPGACFAIILCAILILKPVPSQIECFLFVFDAKSNSLRFYL